MVDASKIEMPLLNIAFLELKQVSAFCAGALACSRDREATQVISAIHDSINNILKNICGNVDEAVEYQVGILQEVEKKPPQDIPIEELYLDSRLLTCIRHELRTIRADRGEEDTEEYMLSEVMKVPLREWLRVPNLGKKSLAQLYWKCHDAGHIFSKDYLNYTMKKFINSCKYMSETNNG